MKPQGLGLFHKSLVQAIVEDIEGQIARGDLKPGQRLMEQSMCETLGVSRSPLREAFRILENQGFLTNKARRGVFVASLSRKEAMDIYIVRANLESLAVYLVVRAGNPEVTRRLREIHEKMAAAVASEDRENYMKYNVEFHETLISACENECLIDMLRRLHKQTFRYRAMLLSTPGKSFDSVKRHEALIQSIEEGDASRAEKVRKEAILNNIALMESMFEDSVEDEE